MPTSDIDVRWISSAATATSACTPLVQQYDLEFTIYRLQWEIRAPRHLSSREHRNLQGKVMLIFW